MRRSVKDFIGIVCKEFALLEPIYEFGALQVAGQEEFANLRPFFPGKQYVGCDYREGRGVDKVLDLHNIDVPSGTVGAVLSVDTLEHVQNPYKALEEIYRILKPGGLVVITSVMNFPIHAYPYDYWRFTPEAFKSILKPFESSFAGYAGLSNFPDVVVGIGFKGVPFPQNGFMHSYEKWQFRHRFSLEYIARAFIPSAILPVLLKIYRG